MDKELFDDAIGEAPPSTVDVDAAIARGRRAARLRMVGSPAVGVAATVLVAVGAVGFTVLRGPEAFPAASTEPTSPPGGCKPSPELIDPAPRTRLTTLVPELMREQLGPDTQFAPDPQDANLYGEAYGPFEFHGTHRVSLVDLRRPVHCSPEYLAYVGAAQLDGEWRVVVRLAANEELPPLAAGCETEFAQTQPGTELQCERRTGPSGERIHIDAGRVVRDVLTQTVSVSKPDGTVVDLLVQHDLSPARPARTLSVDRAIEIVLDPEMTMFP